MACYPNRSKHCWLGHIPNGDLAAPDLRFLADCFDGYSDAFEVYSWFREPDYRNGYKELRSLVNELSRNAASQRFELLSFWRINRDNSYVTKKTTSLTFPISTVKKVRLNRI